MLSNFGHSLPVAFNEDGNLVLADVAHPAIGAPELPDDASREAGRKVALWLLELLGPKATGDAEAHCRKAAGLHRATIFVHDENGLLEQKFNVSHTQ